MTANRHNIGEALDAYRLLSSIGVYSFRVKPMFASGVALGNEDTRESGTRRRRSFPGRTILTATATECFAILAITTSTFSPVSWLTMRTTSEGWRSSWTSTGGPPPIRSGRLARIRCVGFAATRQTLHCFQRRCSGETDIVSSGAARRPGSRETVCLFRLDLLQTSVSLRNWRQLPTDVYNKNGRYGSETIRLNIGPFAAIEARIFKRPHLSTEDHPQLRREAHITLWRNAGFLGGAALRERRYPARDRLVRNADLRAGRKRLFDDWLAGRSNKSSLESHTRTISLFAHYLAAVTTDGANRDQAAPPRAVSKVSA